MQLTESPEKKKHERNKITTQTKDTTGKNPEKRKFKFM